MGSWTLDDIAWSAFDPSRVQPEILRIVKAASLVEYNGAAYAHHLCRIFADDPQFQQTARRWGEEEIQHGRALARWAALADPSFDFAAAFARFEAGFRIDFDSDRSRRGSRSGEMIARCIVETGTSSYYTALRDAAAEPVLKQICARIAADEIRHYKLFYRNLERCLARERIGVWARLRIAVGRIAESEDDELAYAYYAANETSLPYDRRRYGRAYARSAYALYRRHHVERGIAMVFKAVGLTPKGRLSRVASRLAWAAMHYRATRLARAAA
ncbi:MAG: ferritin-like domain-containing protein [Alphaproteobacteria bacterium]|nr:ferritin-like domain-containing protein [Alphaproteobacteria bacterium]